MVVTAWLTRRREDAAHHWIEQCRLAWLLNGSPVSGHADAAKQRARRRLRRWDILLDLATAPQRHRARIAKTQRTGHGTGS